MGGLAADASPAGRHHREVSLGPGCLVQVGNGIGLEAVGLQFEPYRWCPCGVTWDSSRTVVVIKRRRTSESALLLVRQPGPGSAWHNLLQLTSQTNSRCLFESHGLKCKSIAAAPGCNTGTMQGRLGQAAIETQQAIRRPVATRIQCSTAISQIAECWPSPPFPSLACVLPHQIAVAARVPPPLLLGQPLCARADGLCRFPEEST